MRITNVIPVGKLPCFCVSTNTSKYSLNGLIHHNSVEQRRILIEPYYSGVWYYDTANGRSEISIFS